MTTKTIYSVPYKVNTHGNYSLKFINGAWIVSTRLNIDILDTPQPVDYSPVKREVGKSSVVSFLEAKHAHTRINEEGSNRALEARHLCVDKNTLERAMDLYECVGQSAFLRYH
jgi:hypothetical protein